MRQLSSIAVALAMLAGATGFAGAQQAAGEETATAIFAGGCFWCTEADFDKVPGVLSTTSGYIGGAVVNPTYGQVSAGGTGHAEAVKVVYDPDEVDYERLLDIYWRTVDPLRVDAQFCDVGDQYRTAIFAVTPGQKAAAEASRAAIAERFDEPIATEIADAGTFWPAEDYHQDYHEKNPLRYRFYRWNCGRDQRLEDLWGEEAGGLS